MQDGQGQSVEQRVQATFGPQHIAHGVTDIKQKTDVIDTTIQTETISTPKKDYVRYTQLNTSQKNPEGKELDFSKVLNVWGRVDEGGGELYSQSTLGVVPSGNLTAADREALVRFMRDKNLYEFDESKVDRKIENGRPVYVYDVTAKPDLYVTMLKQYAKAVGVTQLESVDPSAYAGRDALQFRVTIDVWSRQFVAVSFGGGQQTEKLSGYGVSKPVALPKESITVDELQSRLQTVQ